MKKRHLDSWCHSGEGLGPGSGSEPESTEKSGGNRNHMNSQVRTLQTQCDFHIQQNKPTDSLNPVNI